MLSAAPSSILDLVVRGHEYKRSDTSIALANVQYILGVGQGRRTKQRQQRQAYTGPPFCELFKTPFADACQFLLEGSSDTSGLNVLKQNSQKLVLRRHVFAVKLDAGKMTNREAHLSMLKQ